MRKMQGIEVIHHLRNIHVRSVEIVIYQVVQFAYVAIKNAKPKNKQTNLWLNDLINEGIALPIFLVWK